MDINQILQDVLKREGGYVNHPDDPGGSTKFGITQATLAWWRGKPVTPEDVFNLTQAEALGIYTRRYVSGPRFDHPGIHELVRAQLIDFGIHSGPVIAIKAVQRATGVEADGKLGPLTFAAMHDVPPELLNNRLVKARLDLIARLVVKHPAQLKFLCGWVNRASSFLVS